jgi:hypothetical protein
VYVLVYGKSFARDQSLHANVSTCMRIRTDVLHVSSAHMNAIGWIISLCKVDHMTNKLDEIKTGKKN